MFYRKIVNLLVLLVLVPPSTFAFQNYVNGEKIIPASEAFKCDELVGYEKGVCLFVAEKVEEKMIQQQIYVTAGEIIQYMSPIVQARQVNTGRSCSHRAWIKSSYGHVGASRSMGLDIRGDLIKKPIVISGEIPVSAYARVNLKEQWGHKAYSIKCKWLKCRKKRYCAHVATDHYYAEVNDTSVTARPLIIIDLQPQFSRLPNDTYSLKIKPIVTVRLDLDNIDTSLKVHGKSGLTAAFGQLFTLPGNMTDLLASIGVSTEAVKDTLKQFGADATYAVVSTLDGLGDVVTLDMNSAKFTNQVIDYYVKQGIKKEAPQVEEDTRRDLENKLNAKLSIALELVNGEREWTISKEEAIREFWPHISPAILNIL